MQDLFGQRKNGDLFWLNNILVLGRGLAPPRLSAHAPQACLATVTTPELMI